MQFSIVCVTEDRAVYAWCADLLHAESVCASLNARYYKIGAKFEISKVNE